MTRAFAARLSSIALAVVLLVAAVAAWKGASTLEFDVGSSRASRLQLFHDAAGAFSEAASDWLSVPPGAPTPQRLRVAGDGARWLRVDPAQEGVTRLCRWRVDGEPASFELRAPAGVSATSSGECLELRPDPGAADPQVVLQFTGRAAQRIDAALSWHRALGPALALAFALAIGAYWLVRDVIAAWLRAQPAPRAWRLLEPRLHLFTVAAMLMFGGAFVYATPPGAVPDEAAHFAKTMRVAWGIPLGGDEDVVLPDLAASFGPFFDMMGTKRAFSRAELQEQLAQPLRCAPEAVTGLHGADGYAPHQYALSALAFRIGCAAGSSFGAFLHAARALNLVLAALLVGWGVRAAARGRVVLVLVALLPMSLFQIASLSADSLVIGLSLAWLGLASGVASGTRALRPVDAGLLGLALAIALLKPGSAWILCSFLFCRSRYGLHGRAAFWKATGMYVLAPMLLHAAFTLAVGGSAPRLEGADPAANLALLRGDPVRVLQIINGTVVAYGGWLVNATIGLLGWLDVPLAPWAYSLALALGLGSLFANAEPTNPMPAWIRPVALAFAAGAFVVLVLPIFIYWTPTGATRITALQGRYFLPLAAFLLVWLSTATPPVLRGWLSLGVLLGALVLDAHALSRLHEAYFVTGR